MKVLLLSPEFPDTFWSFKHALKFIHKRAALPPLGLLTVAAMLPQTWTKRLVDVNVRTLREQDLAWAISVDPHHSEGLGVPRLPGFPSYPETISRYEELSGRAASLQEFYGIFAGYRFAVIMSDGFWIHPPSHSKTACA